ncbi:hypothetical protein Acr_02g0010060 [Actinidia rufa]|uniref:Uncharacterized protein n=1 Tax=Actinidia rufa TaxID=165716 RepID=A0A7J0E9C6_9ERIC|nr:hypothetical protein Acr_02g0010060 [Actinidia rufa]
MEHLKAVTTLRSGREVDKTIYPKVTNTTGLRTAPIPSYGERPNVSVEKLEEERNVEKDESVENDQVGGKAHEGVGVRNNREGKNVVKESVENTHFGIPLSSTFSTAVAAPKKPNHNAEIYKLFEQVKINIPLLDAVKQIPAYAKFLKDLCTVKRTLNVKDKAFLMEQPVLDPDAQIPVILGRPFLATSDAIIQCRNGRVKFSFGNMTCDLKIFDVARQVGDEGSVHEVNYIDTIVQHHIDTKLLSDPLLTCLVNPPTTDYTLSPEVEHIYSLINVEEVQEIQGWIPKFENLPPITERALPSNIQPPKLELKPLPIHIEIHLFRG